LLNDLGEILEAQSRLGEALACASRSVSIMRGAVGQIAGSDGHRILARSLGFEGTLLRQLGRYREAEAPLKEAIAVAETALGAFDREMCVACNNLAVLYKYTGYFDEAEALYRRALDIVERGGAPDDACLATIWHNLGGLEHARGRAEIGEAYARRAWELRRAALVEEHPEMVADAAALAALLDALG